MIVGEPMILCAIRKLLTCNNSDSIAENLMEDCCAAVADAYEARVEESQLRPPPASPAGHQPPPAGYLVLTPAGRAAARLREQQQRQQQQQQLDEQNAGPSTPARSPGSRSKRARRAPDRFSPSALSDSGSSVGSASSRTSGRRRGRRRHTSVNSQPRAELSRIAEVDEETAFGRDVDEVGDRGDQEDAQPDDVVEDPRRSPPPELLPLGPGSPELCGRGRARVPQPLQGRPAAAAAAREPIPARVERNEEVPIPPCGRRRRVVSATCEAFNNKNTLKTKRRNREG